MFLRNYWYVAAMPEEIDNAQLLGRWILNEPVLLYRTENGDIAAMQDICPHRSARLSAGERDGDTVRCLYHGLEFGSDGACLRVPGQDGTPPAGLAVQTYPVVEKWRLVWIWMGDAEKADPAEIIDFPFLGDHENHPHGHALMEIDCNYMLLVDNLMDLTHIPYIHKKTTAVATKRVRSTPPWT